MQVDHRRYAAKIAADYDLGARQYRADDEVEAQSENHQRIGGNLRRICQAFAQPIRVLELGCGTGRYFHWLENVDLLVGTDLSAEMLARAKQPVHANEVSAREVRLLQANIYELNFAAESFDFVYSFGVFGYGAALTPELATNVARWLTPGGRFYFDAIERREMGRSHRLRQSVKSAMLPVLPGGMKRRMAARQAAAVPVFNHTRAEVERVMERAGFCDFAISSNTCHSPLWTGIHLECCARKDGVREPKIARFDAELQSADVAKVRVA